MQRTNQAFRLRRTTPEDMTLVAALVAAIGTFIASFAVLFVALSLIWKGFVFSVLWSWFVASQFAGAPDLNIGESIGIAVVVGLFTRGLAKAEATYGLIGPAASLGIGALLHFVFGVGM